MKKADDPDCTQDRFFDEKKGNLKVLKKANLVRKGDD